MLRTTLLVLLALVAPAGPVLAEPITVPQSDGTVLSLEAPATRIISLSPNLTEMVYAAGAGDVLVAAVEYSDYPEAANHLPRVGDAFRIDIEQIHQLSPDLILAWPSGNPAAAVAQLQDLGFPVWSVEILAPNQIADTLEHIGHVTGIDAGSSVASELRSRISKLETRFESAENLSFFYQIAAQPLYTVNGEHLISQGLGLCGGQNVFGDLTTLAPQVGFEAVLETNPQLLIGPDIEGQPDPLAHWHSWPRISAVKNDHFLLLHADSISRATPRFIDAIEHACTMMDEMRKN